MAHIASTIQSTSPSREAVERTATREARPGFIGRILVVDEQPNFCSLVALELVSAGYDVDTASDLKSAVRAMSSRQYDAMLADTWSKTIEPWALLDNMRAHQQRAAFVAMTMYEDRDVKPLDATLGAATHVPKASMWKMLLPRVLSVVPEQSSCSCSTAWCGP